VRVLGPTVSVSDGWWTVEYSVPARGHSASDGSTADSGSGGGEEAPKEGAGTSEVQAAGA